MPIYEYQCHDCEKPFELFVRSVSNPPPAVCPECGSEHVEKAVSAFATAVSGASPFGGAAASSGASCAPSG